MLQQWFSFIQPFTCSACHFQLMCQCCFRLWFEFVNWTVVFCQYFCWFVLTIFNEGAYLTYCYLRKSQCFSFNMLSVKKGKHLHVKNNNCNRVHIVNMKHSYNTEATNQAQSSSIHAQVLWHILKSNSSVKCSLV